MTLLHVLISRLRAFLGSQRQDLEFERELQAHLTLSEQEKIRQGMSPLEARRAARIELGGVTQLQEAGREARGLPWLDTSLLDIKLGFRMLKRHWGLTLVGGLAMTITIGIGAAIFAAIDTVAGNSLPIQDGDRIVAIQPWDPVAQQDHDTSPQNFRRWRDELNSVQEVGAFRLVERLDGLGIRASVAEMTASVFELVGQPTRIGRPILEEDEHAGAEPVLVIGSDVWESHFSSDPAVLGQRFLLDEKLYTIVGVMPPGFGFPINQSLWTQLSPNPPEKSEQDRSVFVLARLSPGVTLDSAQAEVAALGLLPEESWEDEARMQTRVVPYASTFNDDLNNNPWMIRIILILAGLLLVPPCANIAILLYARNTTRQEEFAARYVLGASRGRIVMQLLVEALILAALAGGAGLLLARQFLWQLQGFVDQLAGIPFWMDFNLSFKTLLFVAGLALFAAFLAGGVPALRSTGSLNQARHHALGSRSGSMRLGRTWTILVGLQIALSMAAMPTAVEALWAIFRPSVLGPGFPAGEYLTGRLGLDPKELPGDQPPGGLIEEPHQTALQSAVIRRLRAEPGITGVTVSARIPGAESFSVIEVESLAGKSHTPIRVAQNRVDGSFFDVYGVTFLAGRDFRPGDFDPNSNPVIVNRQLAQDLAQLGNVVGQRVRYLGSLPQDEPGPWHEIVGVTENLPANQGRLQIYYPLRPDQALPVTLSLHVGPGLDPEQLSRWQEIPGEVDANLRMDRLQALDETYRQLQATDRLVGYGLAAVMLCVLLFSIAGIYTLTSFTVAQRRREIGIRSALGAHPLRLVTDILTRALIPVGFGALGGGGIAFLISYYLTQGLAASPEQSLRLVIPGTELLLILIGFLALLGPARRALRVEATDALREG